MAVLPQYQVGLTAVVQRQFSVNPERNDLSGCDLENLIVLRRRWLDNELLHDGLKICTVVAS